MFAGTLILQDLVKNLFRFFFPWKNRAHNKASFVPYYRSINMKCKFHLLYIKYNQIDLF